MEIYALPVDCFDLAGCPARANKPCPSRKR